MGIWDKDKCTFTNPNELHNEEEMEGIFEDTGLTALDLDKDPHTTIKNKMGNVDEADVQRAYAREQGKDDGTFTIPIRSRQIRRKLKLRTTTASPPGINIATAKYPSIVSGITQETAEDDDAYLLGRSSLALDPARDDI